MASKLTEREVMVVDAVLKEDESTEDDSTINQYIWIQLKDVKTDRIYTSVLTLDNLKSIRDSAKVIKCPNCNVDLTQQQVNEIAKMSKESTQELRGRKLIEFCDKLRMREEPLTLKFDPSENEISPDMIMDED